MRGVSRSKNPSAREGVLRTVATLSREGAFKAKNANTSHTDNICQTDKKAICHTKALAEVSQKANKNRDISGFALNMTKFNRHCETSAGSRGNPQHNTNKIDCHEVALATSRNDGSVKSCNDRISPSIAKSQTSYSPSLAEGARGWVSLDSTAVIVGNDKENSVIASKSQDLRGNLSYNTKKVDCHALDSAKMQNLIARNDGSINSFNDKKTHPQTPSAREGAKG